MDRAQRPTPHASLRRLALQAVVTLGLCGLVAGCGDNITVPAPASADANGSGTAADVGIALVLPGFAAAPQASGPRVQLDGEVQPNGQIVVHVALHDFADLYALAGHLRYDPDGLELVSIEGHTILSGAGYVGRVIATDSPAGRILLGGARVRTSGNGWEKTTGAVVTKQLWATAVFRVLEPGTYPLTFDADTTIARHSNYQHVEMSWQGATIELVEEEPINAQEGGEG